MKLIALKDLPNGVRDGEVFDAPDEHARIHLLVGSAKAAPEPEPEAKPEQRSRGAYRRRDLKAE